MNTSECEFNFLIPSLSFTFFTVSDEETPPLVTPTRGSTAMIEETVPTTQAPSAPPSAPPAAPAAPSSPPVAAAVTTTAYEEDEGDIYENEVPLASTAGKQQEEETIHLDMGMCAKALYDYQAGQSTTSYTSQLTHYKPLNYLDIAFPKIELLYNVSTISPKCIFLPFKPFIPVAANID